MSDRLVPYRPLKQVTADANVMFLLSAAGALGIGTAFANAPIGVRLALAYAWMLVAVLLSEAIAVWRARRRGAELIPRAESYRRIFAERAASPLWQNCVSFGALVASCTGVLALAVLPIDMWPLAVPVVLVFGLFGAVAGAYAWLMSRGQVRETGKGAAPSPFAVVAMRHYSGYALGTAAMLIAATFVGQHSFSGLILLAVFAAGKVTADFLAPPVVINPAAEMPESLFGILRGCVWAILWWGAPMGAAIAIITHHEQGQLDTEGAVAAFAGPSVGAVVFYLFMTVLLRLTRGRVPR